MASKQQMTQAKRAREQAVRERRARKQEKRELRRAARNGSVPPAPDGVTDEPSEAVGATAP